MRIYVCGVCSPWSPIQHNALLFTLVIYMYLAEIIDIGYVRPSRYVYFLCLTMGKKKRMHLFCELIQSEWRLMGWQILRSQEI